MERLTIGAVANLTGVPTHTLEKMEKQALYRNPKIAANPVVVFTRTNTSSDRWLLNV